MGGAESKSKKWENALNAARRNLKYKRKASLESVASKGNEDSNQAEHLAIISEEHYRERKRNTSVEEESPSSRRFIRRRDKPAGEINNEKITSQILPTNLFILSGRGLSGSQVGEADKVNDLEFKPEEETCAIQPIGGEENVNKPVVPVDQNFGKSIPTNLSEIEEILEVSSRKKRISSTFSSEDDSELFTDAVTSPLFSLEGSYHSADDEDFKVAGTMNKSAFTITRHRKVEVPALDNNELQLRHSPNLESNVLKKVASLTLDNALVEARAVGDSKSKPTPHKLQFERCDKFEGQMLVNWFVSSFPEDQHMLKLIAHQFCSHLLSAGVIQPIEDKDLSASNQFKVDRMYVWSRSETPATPLQYSPGKISLSSWPPHEVENKHNNNNNTILPTSLCSERNAQLEREISQLKSEIEKLKAQLEKEKQTKIPASPGTSDLSRPSHLDLSPKPNRLPLKSSPSPSRIPASKFKSPPKSSPQCSPIKTPSTSPLKSSSPARSKVSTKLSFKSSPGKSPRQSASSPVQKSKSSDSITQNFLEKSCQTSPLGHPIKSLSKSFESQLTCDLDSSSVGDNIGDSPSIVPLSQVPANVRSSPGKLCLSLASMSLSDDSNSSNVQSSAKSPSGIPPPPPMEGLEAPAVPYPPPMSVIPPPPPPPPPMCDMSLPPISNIPPPPPMSGIAPPSPPPLPPSSMGGLSNPPPPPPMSSIPPPPSMGGIPPPPSMEGIPPPTPIGGIPPPPPPMVGIPPPPPPIGEIPPPPPISMGGIPPPPPPMGGIPPPPPSSLPGIPPPAPHMNGTSSGGHSPTSQAPSLSPSLASGPAPFPMPPVGGWNANRDRFRKDPVVPPRPMKPLYWTRLIVPPAPPSDVPPLWKELEEVPIENLDEFTELFSRQVTQARPVTSRRRQRTSKVQNVARLIDSKRSQNVGILAQSLHVEFSEIEAAIFNMDTSVVSLEALQQIYDARATDEEIALIRAHLASNPDLQLDKPEQFLADLADIPHFSERIACFMFEADFSDSISIIDSKLNNIKSVCQFLMKSEDLKKVIAIILSLGNFMNGGNRLRGQADGFGLEILPKLKDVKSKDNSLTLLHFIVRTYMRACENPLACPLPVPEPGDVDRACALVFDDVHAQLTALAKKLETVSKSMTRVIRESKPEHLEPFRSKMETCTKTAKNGLTEQLENLEDCIKKFKAVMSFYQYVPKGVPAHEVTPKDLFVLWAPFCHDFKDAWKKEQDRLVKEKVKEMKKKQEERKQSVQTMKKQDSGLKARFQRMERLQEFGNP